MHQRINVYQPLLVYVILWDDDCTFIVTSTLVAATHPKPTYYQSDRAVLLCTQDENVIVLQAETEYQSVVTRTPQNHRTVCRSQGYDPRRQGGERRERGTCMTSDLMKSICMHTHPSEYHISEKRSAYTDFRREGPGCNGDVGRKPG